VTLLLEAGEEQAEAGVPGLGEAPLLVEASSLLPR
jgi:hypothetical protein